MININYCDLKGCPKGTSFILFLFTHYFLIKAMLDNYVDLVFILIKNGL